MHWIFILYQKGSNNILDFLISDKSGNDIGYVKDMINNCFGIDLHDALTILIDMFVKEHNIDYKWINLSVNM